MGRNQKKCVFLQLVLKSTKFYTIMKRITLIFVAVLTMGLTSVFAQKAPASFTGTITSKTSCTGTTDPNIIAQIDGEMTQMVCGNRMKMVQVQEGGLGIIQIVNGDAKMAYVVLDIPGMGKYYIETSGDSIAEGFKNIKTDYNYTGEKKTIAGYECEKVIATMVNLETDEETSTTLYVSKDINPGSDINFASHPGLVGYPLCTEQHRDINGEDVTIINEAVTITPSKKIKPVEFLLPTDAKDIKSNPELMKMLGMGGGDDDDDE